MRPARIISGGQTGSDRAGLDVAIHLGIPWGGWAPRGWISEDGQVPRKYRQQRSPRYPGFTTSFLEAVEGPTAGGHAEWYRERTELNVRDCDATILFYMGDKTPGSRLTHKLCGQYGKVCQPVAICSSEGWGRVVKDIELVRYFISEQHLDGKILNIAGSRESKAPGIYAYVYTILREALR